MKPIPAQDRHDANMQAVVPGETLKGSLESRRWWAVKRKPKSNLLGLKYSSLFEFPPGEVGRA